ncbi:hypothetical protein PspLS_08679 [Pyricularia sp. CBS 133598]|nr:hypothetical protein PspLS_08679 [Pyricularia sp. CBS 133598]
MLLKKIIILGLTAVASAHYEGSTGDHTCGNNVKAANPEVNSADKKTLFRRDSGAMEEYWARFPYGTVKIPTSGEGQLCGIRAILSSLEIQMPELAPFLTVEEMREFANSGETAARHRDLIADQKSENFLEMIESNYPADFLGGVVEEYGRVFKGRKLRLGVRRGEFDDANNGYMIVRTKDKDAGTLWVAHSSSHYEGLRPATGEEIARSQAKKESSQKLNKGRSWWFLR